MFITHVNGSCEQNVPLTTMHETTKRIYAAAKALKGRATLTDVASLIGTTPQTLKNWEGRGASSQGVLLASERIGCDAGWIKTGLGPMVTSQQNVTKTSVRSRVPLISWDAASRIQGENLVLSEVDVVRNVDVFDTEDVDGLFALLVESDSMVSQIPGELSFPPGTILRVRAGPQAQAGNYVIARDDRSGMATFRRLMNDAGRWYLRPINNAYPTQEVADPLKVVIGRVTRFVIEGEI
ncbi:MAG: S24 family peptidase [Hyphomicrobium sp.]